MTTTPRKTLLAAAAVAMLAACGSDAGTGSGSLEANAVVSEDAAAPTAETGASKSEAPAEAAAGGLKVEVVNIAYKPASLEVAAGDEVTWTSGDKGVVHTVTAGIPGDVGVPGVSDPKKPKKTGEFDGQLPDAGATFSHTFSTAGTFAYFCDIHPSMTGEVVVR